MHFKDGINLIDFLNMVKKCDDEVFFETAEGDCLALRSALSQYIFCAITNEKELLQSGTIRCENQNDYSTLQDFLK